MIYERHYCRLCHGKVETRFELKPTPLANLFPDTPNTGEKYPLELRECMDCQHVQIGHVIPDEMLYGAAYKYETPAAQGEQMRQQVFSLKARYPRAGSVFEIGANNGLFIERLREEFAEVSGCDPSSTHEDVADTAFTKAFAATQPQAALIIANNVFAHIDDLHDVFAGIDKMLTSDGALVFEVQYFLDMAERGEFDMIYHEHRDYHTITPLIGFLKKYGLGITHIERIPNHGGSIRVHCHRGPSIPIAEKTIDWDAFREAVDWYCECLRRECSSAQEQVVMFGAPAKACTLIHHSGIESLITYAVDSTPQKQGRYIAGTEITVMEEETLKRSKSGKTLLLAAWNYEYLIRRRYPEYDFIVPFKPRQRLAA